MFWKRKKQGAVKTYDREHLRPVIRSSICTGEEVAGFQELETGRFHEDRLLRDPDDLEQFMKEYGISKIPDRIY